jgi:hypothetical protein
VFDNVHVLLFDEKLVEIVPAALNLVSIFDLVLLAQVLQVLLTEYCESPSIAGVIVEVLIRNVEDMFGCPDTVSKPIVLTKARFVPAPISEDNVDVLVIFNSELEVLPV